MNAPANHAVLNDARILIADDEFVIASDLEFVLQNVGARVQIAGTLADALTLATNEELDAALLDARLGSESSLQVAEALAARQIPFLFFSGQLLPAEVLARFPQARALVKPVDYGKLLDATAQMVRPQ
jgi:DNA-binding NtrC family response regulator